MKQGQRTDVRSTDRRSAPLVSQREAAETMVAILYLDTNHISRLARHPEDSDVGEVIGILRAGSVSLGLDILHLHELSDPAFVSRAEVGRLLDTVSVRWAPFVEKIFDWEVEQALERVLLGSAKDRCVFVGSFDRAYDAPPDAVIPISQMLDAFARHEELRNKLPAAAEHGVRGDLMMKRRAAVIRALDAPMISRIRDANLRRTPSGLVMPAAYPPDELLRRAGGLSAFPAYNIFQGLARTRLGDESYPTEPNDLFDEWHACYTPYVSAIALDRRTVARFRAARLPLAERVTHRLADVPGILRLGTA